MTIEDPIRVGIRETRLALIKNEMRQNDTVRIKYASKYAGIANGWKKWKGEMKGLKKTDGLSKKRYYESEFTKFAAQDGKNYGQILDNLKAVYENTYNDLKTAQVSYYEMFSAFESVQLSRGIEPFLSNKDDGSRLQCLGINRLTNLTEPKTAFCKQTNPTLHRSEIPGSRIGKICTESRPCA